VRLDKLLSISTTSFFTRIAVQDAERLAVPADQWGSMFKLYPRPVIMQIVAPGWKRPLPERYDRRGRRRSRPGASIHDDRPVRPCPPSGNRGAQEENASVIALIGWLREMHAAGYHKLLINDHALVGLPGESWPRKARSRPTRLILKSRVR
jgi:hypothetical protein